MKRVLIIAAAAALAAAAWAWAGTLPDAGDEHVIRFGPLASGVFDFYTQDSEFGGGGGVGRRAGRPRLCDRPLQLPHPILYRDGFLPRQVGFAR